MRSRVENEWVLTAVMELLAEVLRFRSHGILLCHGWGEGTRGHGWGYVEGIPPTDEREHESAVDQVSFVRYFRRYGQDATQVVPDIAAERRPLFRARRLRQLKRGQSTHLRIPLSFRDELRAVVVLERECTQRFSGLEAALALAAVRSVGRVWSRGQGRAPLRALKAAVCDARFGVLGCDVANVSGVLAEYITALERLEPRVDCACFVPGARAVSLVCEAHSSECPGRATRPLSLARNRQHPLARAFRWGRFYATIGGTPVRVRSLRGLPDPKEVFIPLVMRENVEGVLWARRRGRAALSQDEMNSVLVLAGVGAQVLAWSAAARRRKQGEDELAQIIDAVGDELAVLDMDWRITLANAAKRRAFGEDIVGKRCWVVFERNFKQRGPCPNCPSELARRRRETVEAVVYPDAENPAVEITAAPLEIDGSLMGVVEVVRDVRAREAMIRSFAALEQARSFDELCERAAETLVGMGLARARVYRADPETGDLAGHCTAGAALSRVKFRGFRGEHSIYRPRFFRRGVVPVLFVRAGAESLAAKSEQWPVVKVDTVADERLLEKEDVIEWVDIPIFVGRTLVAKISGDKKGSRERIQWHEMQLFRALCEFLCVAFARAEAFAVIERGVAQQPMAEVGMLAEGIIHEVSGPTSSMATSLQTVSERLEELLHLLRDAPWERIDARTIRSMGASLCEVWERPGRTLEPRETTCARRRVSLMLRRAGLPADKAIARRLAALTGTRYIAAAIKGSKALGTLDPLRILAGIADLGATLGNMGASVARVREIIHAMWALAPEKGARETVANVNETLRAALLLVESRTTKGVKLTTSLARGGMKIRCLPSGLTYVWLCLLNNALDAIGTAGRVHVSTRRSPREIRVAVSNDGPQIPAKLVARIFQPGYTTKDGQSGLGLAVADRLVRDVHRGEIAVSSTHGRTRFTVILPNREGTR